MDPVAVRRWLGADRRDSALLELAGLLPGLMAEATIEAWAQIDDPAKRRAAGWLAAAWYMSITAALDAMRAQCPAVPELDRLPEPIERLQKIARSA